MYDEHKMIKPQMYCPRAAVIMLTITLIVVILVIVIDTAIIIIVIDIIIVFVIVIVQRCANGCHGSENVDDRRDILFPSYFEQLSHLSCLLSKKSGRKCL